jgi:hypothetical protein
MALPAAQEAALKGLREAVWWKVITLTTALHGGVLVCVRLDRRRDVSRITNLNIHPDGHVQITAGPIPTNRRKPLRG